MSCGLDRCLRVHHAENGRLLQRQYLKQRLNCVSLIASEFESTKLKARSEEASESSGSSSSSSGSSSSDGSDSSGEYSSGDEEGMWRQLDRNERASKKRRKR